MGLSSTASALATGAVYRLTGWNRAGKRLVRALGSDDPNTQQVAGMSLVRGGARSRPLLESAVAGGMVGVVEDVLADLDSDSGDDEELHRLAESDNPKVAEAARSLIEKRKKSD